MTKNITQESVQEAIFANIHQKRFFLAEAAPICMGGLRGKFGYNAITRTARAILNGTYKFHPTLIKPREKSAKNVLEFGK
jgi:hypothetical protein